MANNGEQHKPVDPERKEKGFAEHEEKHHTPLSEGNEHDRDRYDWHDRSIRETDDPEEVDREGGDIAGTASGNLDDGEV